MSPIDPDEAPTQAGDTQPRGRGPDQTPEEDRTVPSLQAAGASKPKAAGASGSDPLIGKTIGGCRIESLLGRGAMGAVYKARQVSLDRDVAVKVIRPEMMTDPRMLKRFEVEARTVGKFNSAHVVMVHDVGFALGVHFLVMEFVQGKNMREHSKLLAGGRLPAGEAIPLLRQACKGLEEAQRLGVIHRDIKPDNLMLTDRGVLKIADFGIAKPIHEDFNMTMTAELIGTPLYMSPEQCQGTGDLDFRSDMYSLGATFYYLLTGEPPIRASSVYELIQTKTKLENLCLWKALAELDQNHPLSRVIERMTSLDRDDRYESYEGLLNDIVLVEQGGTVNIPAKGSGKSVAARAKAARKKQRAVLAAVLLVVVAGGGYAWATSGESGGGGSSVVDAGRVKAQLQSFRDRLARSGPDDGLRKEVADLQVEQSTKRPREELLEDVDRGVPVLRRLQRLKMPTALVLPFDDLRKFFGEVDKAVAVEGQPGKELQTWLAKARTSTRAESQLGAMAVTSLTVAFGQWQADRPKAGNDEKKLLALEARLKGIADGRGNLIELIPAQKETLDRDFKQDTLDRARLGLKDTSPRPVDDVDVSEVLKELQQQFDRVGPDAALVERTKKLVANRDDQLATKDQLLNALQKARTAVDIAEGIYTNNYPKDPGVPFNDVAGYYEKLERALDPLRTAGVLPQWADTLRTRLRDGKNLQVLVVTACRSAFTRWNKQRDDLSGNGIDQLESDLQQLRLGITNAGKLFPDAKAELEQIIPTTALTEAQTNLERTKKKQLWLGSARKLLDLLDGVKMLGDWRVVAVQSSTDLENLRTSAADFATDPAVMRDLQRATQLRDRWAETDRRVVDLAARIAAGDLTGAESVARTGLPGAEGRDEFRLLVDASTKCREALFEALDKELSIDKATTLLAEARAVLKTMVTLVPEADLRIKNWNEKVEALKRTATGMVAIGTGRTRASPEQVPSFFLSATECSYGDYVKFLKELRAAVAGLGDSAARLQAVASRLSGAELTADRLQALLDNDPRRQPDKTPIERVDWYGAAACAAWSGLALPTAAEWALAAYGDGNRFAYPWGADWSNDPQQRNPNNKQLAEVDAGGLSWRTLEGKRIHHLGGNVAEWLATEPGAGSAMVAGGRFSDSDGNAREQAGGKMIPADKTDPRPGIGFRTVLRPRSFLGSLWPR